MAKADDPDASLKRLGGGRWQTRDERFTIEPQSGTWVVVDAEQTDDLGLPLVRGPFGSLGAAKTAIATARTDEPADSPLKSRLEQRADEPPAAGSGEQAEARTPSKARKPSKGKREEPTEPTEPRWVADLEPDERRRARQLIDRLTKAGAPDPEGTARRDLVGDVPATAAFAVGRAIAELGDDATPASVADLLVDGRDRELGVRWRLVDGDGRPITLDLD